MARRIYSTSLSGSIRFFHKGGRDFVRSLLRPPRVRLSYLTLLASVMHSAGSRAALFRSWHEGCISPSQRDRGAFGSGMCRSRDRSYTPLRAAEETNVRTSGCFFLAKTLRSRGAKNPWGLLLSVLRGFARKVLRLSPTLREVIDVEGSKEFLHWSGEVKRLTQKEDFL